MRAVRRDCTADAVKILHREEFPTQGMTWQEVLEEFGKRTDRILTSGQSIAKLNASEACV